MKIILKVAVFLSDVPLEAESKLPLFYNDLGELFKEEGFEELSFDEETKTYIAEMNIPNEDVG